RLPFRQNEPVALPRWCSSTGKAILRHLPIIVQFTKLTGDRCMSGQGPPRTHYLAGAVPFCGGRQVRGPSRSHARGGLGHSPNFPQRAPTINAVCGSLSQITKQVCTWPDCSAFSAMVNLSREPGSHRGPSRCSSVSLGQSCFLLPRLTASTITRAGRSVPIS